MKPRVLIVDDSAHSRAQIAELLEEGGCDVVGRAMDGSMALKMALELDPDVITCDLEMPRMDGMTFIRLLRHRSTTPIVVVTSDARPEAALHALDLGARDFVVKPGQRVRDLKRLGPQLLLKIFALAEVRPEPEEVETLPEVELPVTPAVVVFGASTGGPQALRDVFSHFVRPPVCPIVIAQHMPQQFTTAFATRLARTSGLDVAEMRDGEKLTPGQIRVIPGGHHGSIGGVPYALTGHLSERVDARWAPSVDLLFKSGALCAGSKALGVVLTGMGRDGKEGGAALRGVGATLWCEARSTAVIDGMPRQAAEGHGEALRFPLDNLAALVARACHADADGT